jgi:hypothetical protein
MAFWTNRKMMRGAKAVIGAALMAGTFAFSAPAMAQEVAPEHLALARQYIDLTDRGAVFETTVVEVGIEAMRQIVQQNPEILDEVNTAIGEAIKDYNGRKGELLDQFARVYAMRFSMEELQQIVDFYSTPTGQKLATSSAQLNADVGRVLNVYTNNLRTEFLAKVRSELRELGVEI